MSKQARTSKRTNTDRDARNSRGYTILINEQTPENYLCARVWVTTRHTHHIRLSGTCPDLDFQAM